MGVFNPNGDMPTNCYDCYEEKEADCDINKGVDSASNYKDSRYPKCPLIEIDLVRCGECKYMRKYALRSDEPTGIWCHRWSVPRLVTDDAFCSYGERRADDNKRRSV